MSARTFLIATTIAAGVILASSVPTLAQGAGAPGYGWGWGYGGCPGATGPGMMMGQGMGPGMMGQGMGPGVMGPGMMGQGMGPGMMGQGMGPGMVNPGMMGQGMGSGMMGQGMGSGMAALPNDLSADQARHMLQHRLVWQGNPNLKLGTVEETDADTIVAEIVTSDGSLVQRFKVDRHTGWMQPAQ